MFIATSLLPLLGLSSLALASVIGDRSVASHGAAIKHASRRNHGSAGSRHNSKHGKRINGQATYYATGLGACGGWNKDSDWIVALTSDMWDGGSHCGQQLTINAFGKSATATVVDMCPGCGYGHLDMSPGLFQHFADESVGEFEMEWDWGSGNPAPAPAAKPSSSKAAYTPPPTSTHHSTSTPVEQPSSSSAAPSSSSAPASSAVSASSVSASGTVTGSAPASTSSGAATTSGGSGGAINQQQQVVAGFAWLATYGRQTADQGN